jgi:membrane protein YqaA with SNARE-associated domain
VLFWWHDTFESCFMIRKLYNWVLELAARPTAERWLFAISFMESSFFPIPPHAMLAPMCLARPDKALRFAFVCTVASILGALLGYAIGYFLFESVGHAILSALGMAESFPKSQCYINEYGAQIILIKGATPIPFKLLTITAGFAHMNLLTFVLASLVSRAFQFFLVAGLFWKFGPPIKLFIDKYLAMVTAAFLIIVVGGFVALSFLSHGPKTDKCNTPLSSITGASGTTAATLPPLPAASH